MWPTGLVTLRHVGSFPGQGSNPRPLHWQVDSCPLRHQGSPHALPRCSVLEKCLQVYPQALSVLTTHPLLSWVGLPGASLVPSLSVSLYIDPTVCCPWAGLPHSWELFTASITHQLCITVASCLPASDGCWVPGLYRHSAEQWGCPCGQACPGLWRLQSRGGQTFVTCIYVKLGE